MDDTLNSEQLLGIFVGLGCVVVFVIRWIREAEPMPEPWSHEVEEQLARSEIQPLCQRCLTPHSKDAWFCPECGLPASATTNLAPNLYPLSIGDAFRAFTGGKVRISLLTVTGYSLVSLAFFPVLVPVYWFFLFRNLLLQRRQTGSPASLEQSGP